MRSKKIVASHNYLRVTVTATVTITYHSSNVKICMAHLYIKALILQFCITGNLYALGKMYLCHHTNSQTNYRDVFVT